MDKNKVLQKLLGGTATKKEIEALKQALADGEISISGDVNRSVVIIGSGNKVELTSEALGILKPESTTEEPIAGESPYMGLRYFDTTDADLFYGREVLTAELLKRVKNESFLAIVGASGSGKSSVARAGLIPAWKKENEKGIIHVITPTAHPLESLAASLTRESESVTATSTLMDDLSRAARSLRLYAKKTFGEVKLLLLVDQFEEAFTLCKDADERKAFIENLLSLADENGTTRLVITLRADFYHHCFEYEGLRLMLEKHQANLGTMTQEDLREAITRPAQTNGWDFQPGLVDLILQDIGTEPGALPLLSHALLETWKRRQGRTLTLQGYHEAGGVKKAITQTAEGVYDKLSKEEQSIARSIFLRLTELGEGTQDTRRRVKMDELGQSKEQDAVAKVLKTLTDARLVTAEEDSAEVAHEALIREWGTLRKWLDEDRESLRLHRHLTESAMEWERAGKDETYLDHRAGRLDDALLLEDSSIYRLSEIEQAYLKECVAYQKREQNRRERLRRQITYSLGIGFFIMLVVALMAGIQWQRAEKQSQIAFAGQLAAQAKLITPINETMLAQRNLLSIEANRRYPNLESRQNINDIFLYAPVIKFRLNLADSNNIYIRNNLIANITTSSIQFWDISTGTYKTMFPYAGNNRSHGLFSDGKILITVLDNYIYVWDVLTGGAKTPFPGGVVVGVYDFNQNGDLVAYTREPDFNVVHIGDVVSQEEVIRLRHDEKILDIIFSPNGKFLATKDRQFVYMWDLSTGKEKNRLLYTQSSYMYFSPDNRFLAILENNKVIYLWNTLTGQEVATFLLNEYASNIFFSPDGNLLVVYDKETVRIWKVSTGQEIASLKNVGDIYFTYPFSPDGKYLLTRDEKIIRLWDSANWQESTRLPHGGYINDSSFSPDGKYLATSEGRKIHLWDPTTGLEPAQMLLNSNYNRLGFNQEGNRLVAVDTYGNATIWQLESDWQPLKYERTYAISPDRKKILFATSCPEKSACPVTISVFDVLKQEDYFSTVITGPFYGVAFSENGNLLAVGDAEQIIHVWDIVRGKETTRIKGQGNYLQFSSNGQMLAFVVSSKGIYVWDLIDNKEVFNYQNPIINYDFSPNGKDFSFWGTDNTIFIWDISNNQEVLQIPNAGNKGQLVFSPNGDLLASNDNKTIRVWDALTGKEIQSLLHNDTVTAFSFNFSGNSIVTASSDKSVFIWDLSHNEETTQLLHDGIINAFAFSSDDRFLVTGSEDNIARVWEVSSGKEIGRMLHESAVYMVAFSSDGKKIISSGDTTRIWLWSSEDLVNAACIRISRNFTRQEWNHYFPDEDYKATCSNLPIENEQVLEPSPNYNLIYSVFSLWVGALYLVGGWIVRRFVFYQNSKKDNINKSNNVVISMISAIFQGSVYLNLVALGIIWLLWMTDFKGSPLVILTLLVPGLWSGGAISYLLSPAESSIHKKHMLLGFLAGFISSFLFAITFEIELSVFLNNGPLDDPRMWPTVLSNSVTLGIIGGILSFVSVLLYYFGLDKWAKNWRRQSRPVNAPT